MDREKLKECKEKAKALVAQMTLEEAASQLRFDAPGIPRLKIPSYNWWNEALHGVARAGIATVFPQAIAMAAMFDTKGLEAIADIISTEARAKFNAQSAEGDREIFKGLTMWSPNINIFRDPRWGRGHETYGEDPHLTGELGKAFIRGLQGNGEYMKAAACAKHFAVHSGPESLRHEFDAKVSKKDLWETYLPAFEEAVTNAGVEAVMGAYNRTNGEPCCGSKTLLVDILRKCWKFDGHVVSDCFALADFHEHHMVTKNATESAALALKSGCDLNCGITYLYILKAYEEGLVSEADIRQAAERLFTTRYKLGLFDEHCEYHQIPMEENDTKEHRQAARKAAAKSMVLLENNGILPLDIKKLNRVGVIGPVADSRKVLEGNYNGTSSHYVTLQDGIREVCEAENVSVYYSPGSLLNNPANEYEAKSERRLGEAKAVARRSDVVFLCVGLDPTMEGEEGNDTTDGFGDKQCLGLSDPQKELCDAVFSVGTPVILLVTGGSSIDISPYNTQAAAVLYTWYSGEEGGHGAADLLFGKCSPSGRLPITIYSEKNTLPEFTDYAMQGRTYRYMTEKPLYSFGYGLSYTTFAFENFTAQIESDGVKCAVDIKNTGAYDSDTVIQVYIRYEGEAFEKPLYSLKHFDRLHLASKDDTHYEFTLVKKLFESVLEDGTKQLLPGCYRIFLSERGPYESAAELAVYFCG